MPFAVAHLDGVAARVLDGEVAEDDAVGGDQQALGAAALVVEGEDRAVLAFAADGDAVDRKR